MPGRLDWQYTTDDVGNILAIADGLNPTGSRSFSYQDGQYFLTGGDGPWGKLSWTYDRIGNRLTETRDGVTSTYNYVANATGGRNPKLATVVPPLPGDATRYFYDPAGNQTYRATETEKLRLDYDAERRLSQLLFDSPERAPARSQMTYDGRSFLEHAESFFPVDATTAHFAVDATYSSEGLLFHRRSESRQSAAKDRREATLTSATAVLYLAGRPVGLYEKRLTTPPGGSQQSSSRLLYLTPDHLGSPALATDSGGSDIWSGGFEPFGADYSGAQAAEVFLRFPGQWVDESWDNDQLESGLLQNVHRWYGPQSARFTRPDPIGPVKAIDYLYARANPLRFIDPLGLQPGALGLPGGAIPCHTLAKPDPKCCKPSKGIPYLAEARSQTAHYCRNKQATAKTNPSGTVDTTGYDDPSVLGGITRRLPWYRDQGDPCVNWCLCAHERRHLALFTIPGPDPNLSLGDQLTPNGRECQALKKEIRCLSLAITAAQAGGQLED